MKEGYTDVSILLDRSASMYSQRFAVIENFNKFIYDQQKVNRDIRVSLYQFNHEYQPQFEGRRVQESPLLEEFTYDPKGNTSLLEAITRTIDRTGDRLRSMTEPLRPEKVVFVIITDGEENWSPKEYTIERVNEMIKHQTDKYGWEFVYLGANQDAITNAARLGIRPGNTMGYQHLDKGYRHLFVSLSDNLRNYSTGASSNMNWTESQIKEANKSD